MSQMYQIHPNYNVWFRTIGSNLQTRVTILSGENYDQDSETVIVEPGRTIVIGDIHEELQRLIGAFGKPKLNEFTATSDRKAGIFSTRSYDALRDFAYAGADDVAPRVKKTEQKQIVYRDMA